jgi:D-lactate dehydrogenase
VNTEDLIDALKMGNIGAAGLDVYEKKEQFSLVTTLLKNWEIIYTLYFAPF